MKHCGLKRIDVCITNAFQNICVENVVRTLEKLLRTTDIEVTVGKEILSEKKNVHAKRMEDCLIIGDTQADIGLGNLYAGNAPFVIYEAEDIDLHYLQMVWARKNRKPLVIAETERLLIREMMMEDLDDLYELYDSLRDCPYVEPLYERKQQEEYMRNYINNMYAFFGYGLWLVYLKDTGKLVARIGIENRMIDEILEQELGYLVDAGYWHCHIALEGCKAVLGYAANVLQLRKIHTCIDVSNDSSIMLAEKLGFKRITDEIDGVYLFQMNLEKYLKDS